MRGALLLISHVDDLKNSVVAKFLKKNAFFLELQFVVGVIEVEVEVERTE